MIVNIDGQKKMFNGELYSKTLIFESDGRLFKAYSCIGSSGASAKLEHLTKNGDWVLDIYQDGYNQTGFKAVFHGGDNPKQHSQKHVELKASAESLTQFMPIVRAYK